MDINGSHVPTGYLQIKSVAFVFLAHQFDVLVSENDILLNGEKKD